MNRNLAHGAAMLALAASLGGCAGMDYQERGTVVGAGIGAAAGAAITGDVGGALGGGVIGGVIGNQVGRDRDERDERHYRSGYYDRYGNWHYERD